jgi:hypothetical protein
MKFMGVLCAHRPRKHPSESVTRLTMLMSPGRSLDVLPTDPKELTLSQWCAAAPALQERARNRR